MESEILEELEQLKKDVEHLKQSQYKRGYLKAITNIREIIKEKVAIRDKTGYYKS